MANYLLFSFLATVFLIYKPSANPEGSYACNHQYFDVEISEEFMFRGILFHWAHHHLRSHL
jgi:hypothetical protein